MSQWPCYLPRAIWALNITTRPTTGYAPFTLHYGRTGIQIPSYATITTRQLTREELLEVRLDQILLRDDNSRRMARSLQKKRDTWVQKRNDKITSPPLRPGDLVLVYDLAMINVWGKKMQNVWIGPYRIRSKPTAVTYILEDLDGTQIAGSVHGQRG